MKQANTHPRKLVSDPDDEDVSIDETCEDEIDLRVDEEISVNTKHLGGSDDSIIQEFAHKT